MATGPVITCQGNSWTLVFDGPVDGVFTGSAQCLKGRAYFRVATSLPAVTEKGFVIDGSVIPLQVRDTEKVYARPVNGRSCEVIMG